MEPPRPTTATRTLTTAGAVGRGGNTGTYTLSGHQTHAHSHNHHAQSQQPSQSHPHSTALTTATQRPFSAPSGRNPPYPHSTHQNHPAPAPSGVVLHQGRFRTTTLGCFLDTPMNHASAATPATLFGSYLRPQSSPGSRPVFTGDRHALSTYIKSPSPSVPLTCHPLTRFPLSHAALIHTLPSHTLSCTFFNYYL